MIWTWITRLFRRNVATGDDPRIEDLEAWQETCMEVIAANEILLDYALEMDDRYAEMMRSNGNLTDALQEAGLREAERTKQVADLKRELAALVAGANHAEAHEQVAPPEQQYEVLPQAEKPEQVPPLVRPARPVRVPRKRATADARAEQDDIA